MNSITPQSKQAGMASARKKAALCNMVVTAQGPVVQDSKKLTPVYDTFMSVPNYHAQP
jgi:hypothetical protein